ncbi:predicted protein [Postia placenta Mad-698-R]|nr:predicted protein [Postia placenta Mad-698-R]
MQYVRKKNGTDDELELDKEGKPRLDIDVRDQNGTVVRYRTIRWLSDDGANDLRSRGTRVWEVCILDKNKEGVDRFALKDQWIDADRQREGMIIEQLRNANADKQTKDAIHQSLLTVEHHGDVYVEGMLDHTRSLMARDGVPPMHSGSKLQQIPEDEVEETTTTKLSKRTQAGVGNYQTPDELGTASAQKIETYHAKVHYRIVFKEVATSWVSFSMECCVASCQISNMPRCWVMVWATKSGLSFMSVEVYDLEYRFPPESQEAKPKPPPKVATLDRIRSIQLGKPEKIATPVSKNVRTVKVRTVPFRYNPLHDIESLWWVAIYFVLNTSVVKVGGEPPSMDASQRGHYSSQRMYTEFLARSSHARFMALRYETDLKKQMVYLHAAIRGIAIKLNEIREQLVSCYLKAEQDLGAIDHTVGHDLLYNVFITLFGKIISKLQEKDIQIDILRNDPRQRIEDPFEIPSADGQNSVTDGNGPADDDTEEDSDGGDQGSGLAALTREVSVGDMTEEATAKDGANDVVVEDPDAGRSVDKATESSVPQISTEPLVEGRSTRPQRKRAPPVRYGTESNVNALPMCPNSSWAAERQAYGTARSMPVVGSVVMDPRDLRRPKMVDMGSWHTETLSVSLSEWRGAKLETSGWRCEEAGQSSETGTLLVSLMVTVRIRSLSYSFTPLPMFQTLSSFLPSTIQQFGSDKPAPTPEVAPALPRQPPPSDMRPVEEQPVLYHWTLLADETAGSSGHPSYTSAMARKHCYYANFADQLRARSGSRKIFGKLFKRKEGDVGTPPPSPLPLNQSVMPSMPSMDSTRSKRTSLLSAHGHVLSASVSEPPLQPPVLGIQPSLRSPTVPPKGRPTKYVWIVRKWLKGEPESMFRDVKDRLQEARNGNAAAGLEGVVEVRFEWSRGRSTQKRGRDGEHVRRESTRRRNRASLVGSSATPSTASLHHPSTQSPVRQPQSQSQRTLSPGTPHGARLPGPADVEDLLNLSGALVSGLPRGEGLELDLAINAGGDAAQRREFCGSALLTHGFVGTELGELHLCHGSVVEIAKMGLECFKEGYFVGKGGRRSLDPNLDRGKLGEDGGGPRSCIIIEETEGNLNLQLDGREGRVDRPGWQQERTLSATRGTKDCMRTEATVVTVHRANFARNECSSGLAAVTTVKTIEEARRRGDVGQGLKSRR